jgi:hypothetical protein
MPAAILALRCEQGATFKRIFTLKNASGSVIDLTNFTFTGQVRQGTNSSTELLAFTFTKATDAATGVVTMSITPSATLGLNNVGGPTFKDGKVLQYDVDMTDSVTGTVTRILNGSFALSPTVTK